MGVGSTYELSARLWSFVDQPFFHVMASRSKTRKQRARRNKQHQHRQDGELLLRQAYTLHQQGESAEAEKAYEKFLGRFPRHAEALGNFGLLLHSQGFYQRAVNLYEQAVKLSPRLSHSARLLGLDYMRMAPFVETATGS